jgi:hypothetical protein
MSPDGATVIFAELGDVDIANGAYLRPTRGGTALRLGDGAPTDLAGDGRGVLALVVGPNLQLVVYPESAGETRPVPLPGIDDLSWARWGAGPRLVVGGAAPGRPPRIWRVDPGGAPVAITAEGVFGRGIVSPDGRTVAFTDRGALLVAEVDRVGAPRVIPGSFDEELVCGWHAGGTEVFVRSTSAPVQVRRIATASGAAVAHVEIAP